MPSSILMPIIRDSHIHSLKRREQLKLSADKLWKIESGIVRAYTLTEEGETIGLGFWGAGDVIGQPLAGIQPYELECLTNVQLRNLQPDADWNLAAVLLTHLHQTQELLRLVKMGILIYDCSNF